MASTSKLAAYKDLLIKLLPKGRLWRPKDQPVFDKVLASTSQELCRVDDRIKQMFLEVDTRTTNEALDQWEGVLGLPDECTPDDLSNDERRQQATQKFTNVGGLSAAFYEETIENLGFTATVENRVNFVAGRGRAGDPISNYWNREFVAGSPAGMALTEVS